MSSARRRAPSPGPPVGVRRRAPYRWGVYRFLLTPRWWGINVFVLLAIPFCVFMGSWQLSRFEGRVQDHRTATEQAAASRHEEAVPLARMLPVDKATSGRRVVVERRVRQAVAGARP